MPCAAYPETYLHPLDISQKIQDFKSRNGRLPTFSNANDVDALQLNAGYDLSQPMLADSGAINIWPDTKDDSIYSIDRHR
jgi:hypothetical protein